MGDMQVQSQTNEWKNAYGIPSSLNCKSISNAFAPLLIAQSTAKRLLVI